MTNEQFLQELTTYFKRQEKEACTCLGVELEHFIVDKRTLRSYAYSEPGGQKEILASLAEDGWHVITREEDNILGLEKDGNTITLEPGGQFEISLKPLSRVDEVEAQYRQILREVEAHLTERQAIVALGYHPKTKINELPILPKSRYGLMFDYFKGTGTCGHNMMKGTAATQVSVDYVSEEDFKRKFKLAHFLSPLLAYLFDCSPIFEGELYEKSGLRIHIWENTDPKRSKLIPGALDQPFGYREYAAYILKNEPILIQVGDQVVYTRRETVEELLPLYDFTEKEREHLLGMVFPDVRLKKYIEIRMADALPMPYAMAVPALIKGIFYNEENLEKYLQYANLFRNQDVETVNQMVQDQKLLFYKSFNLQDICMDMLADARRVLEPEEQKYLDAFRDVFSKHGSVSTLLKEKLAESQEAFLRAITVQGDAE